MTSMSYRIRFISFWSQKNSDNPQTTSHQPPAPANGTSKLINKTVQPSLFSSPRQDLPAVRFPATVMSPLLCPCWLVLSIYQSSLLRPEIWRFQSSLAWLILNSHIGCMEWSPATKDWKEKYLVKCKSDILTSITCGRRAGYTEHNTGKCSFKELQCKNTDEAWKFMFFLSIFKRFPSKHP